MANQDVKIDELYKSRNEHGKKIAIIEQNIEHINAGQDQIRGDIKENHVAHMDSVKDLQETMNDFISNINNLPAQNKKDIENIKKKKCAPMEEEMNKLSKKIACWGGAIALLGFVIMAYLAWKQGI